MEGTEVLSSRSNEVKLKRIGGTLCFVKSCSKSKGKKKKNQW